MLLFHRSVGIHSQPAIAYHELDGLRTLSFGGIQHLHGFAFVFEAECHIARPLNGGVGGIQVHAVHQLFRLAAA